MDEFLLSAFWVVQSCVRIGTDTFTRIALQLTMGIFNPCAPLGVKARHVKQKMKPRRKAISETAREKQQTSVRLGERCNTPHREQDADTRKHAFFIWDNMHDFFS